MEIYFTKRFLKESKLLPSEKQIKLSELLIVLKTNPYNLKLNTKKLSAPLLGVLSFRIGQKYRVLFIFENKNTLKLISVKHRKDIYRK